MFDCHLRRAERGPGSGIWKSTDAGVTWTRLTGTPLIFARVVREVPVRRGLLYLRLENALYVSFNDGDQWEPMQLDLPPAPV